MKKSIKLTLGVLIGVFILIQFIRIDKTNPPIDRAIDFSQIENSPIQVSAILKESCYDCHSHETKYPWYSNVAPVSWVLKNHVLEGREHLNFSLWGNYPADERAELMEKALEEIEAGKMPMNTFVWLHPKAIITPAKRAALLMWLKESDDSDVFSTREEEEENEEDSDR